MVGGGCGSTGSRLVNGDVSSREQAQHLCDAVHALQLAEEAAVAPQG